MFIFAFAFIIKRYDLLRMRLNNHGVDLVFHGKLDNQVNSLGLKNITTFLENYANLHGYPQPGRVSSIKNAEIFCDHYCTVLENKQWFYTLTIVVAKIKIFL